MGATGSRSSETVEVPILDYSKLMQAPSVGGDPWNFIRFRDLWWDVSVTPVRDKDTGVADSLNVGVFIGVHHSRKSALGTDISIEILDHTGEHTVFHRESSRGTREEASGLLLLGVRRSELEASSCVNVDHDIVRVRCTLTEQQRPSLLGDWFLSKPKEQLPVAMTRSHTLTVDSLSKIKAALQSGECAYSTRFAVGGSRWYLKLNPTLAAVHLVRATKEDDGTRTTTEFSFALEGAVNVDSGKMRHTFDRGRPDSVFEYQPPEELSASSTDRLVVRCCVTVIPAAVVPTAVPPSPESVVTPLLSAMYGG